MVAGLSGSDKTWRHPFPFQIVLKDKIKETFGTNMNLIIFMKKEIPNKVILFEEKHN